MPISNELHPGGHHTVFLEAISKDSIPFHPFNVLKSWELIELEQMYFISPVPVRTGAVPYQRFSHQADDWINWKHNETTFVRNSV